MKSSRSALLVFTAVLGLSLAGKILSNRPAPAPDNQVFANRLAALLGRHGYKVAREPFENSSSVRAFNGACRIWATESNAHRTFEEVIRRRGRLVGPIRYIFEGKVYESQPRAQPLLSFYWWRELRRIGVDAPRRPVVAVAASDGCDITAIDWRGLAALPA